MYWSCQCLVYVCMLLTQCRSLRDWVCGGPPCHQLKPREETMSVTFPTAFSRACFACSAPSSDPGTETRFQERIYFQVIVQLRLRPSKQHFRQICVYLD